MSDIMYPVSFGNLMNHIMTEYKMYNRIYNVNKILPGHADDGFILIGHARGQPTALRQRNYFVN